MNQPTKTLLATAITSLLLAGCGGGSSGSSDAGNTAGNSNSSDNTSNAPTSVWRVERAANNVTAGQSTPNVDQYSSVRVYQVVENSNSTTLKANDGVPANSQPAPSTDEIQLKSYKKHADYTGFVTNADWNEVAHRETFANSSQIKTLTYSGGPGNYSKTSYIKDANGFLSEKKRFNVDGDLIGKYSYVTDAQGRWTKFTISELNNRTGNFVSQVIKRTYTDGQNGVLTIEQITYNSDPDATTDYEIIEHFVETYNADGYKTTLKKIYPERLSHLNSYNVYAYNPDGTLSQLTVYRGLDDAGTVYQTYTYEYTTDGNGNKTRKENLSNYLIRYTIYNAQGKVIEKSSGPRDGTKTRYDEINTYDANGNRLTSAFDRDGDGRYEGLSVRTYDAQNRLLTSKYYHDSNDSGKLNIALDDGDYSELDYNYTTYAYSDTQPTCADIFNDILSQVPSEGCLMTPEAYGTPQGSTVAQQGLE